MEPIRATVVRRRYEEVVWEPKEIFQGVSDWEELWALLSDVTAKVDEDDDNVAILGFTLAGVAYTVQYWIEDSGHPEAQGVPQVTWWTGESAGQWCDSLSEDTVVAWVPYPNGDPGGYTLVVESLDELLCALGDAVVKGSRGASKQCQWK